VIKSGTRRWIVNPPSFNAGGYNWSAVMQVDQATLDSIALGAPMPPVDGSVLTAPPDRRYS
jgi:hypothetical protein